MKRVVKFTVAHTLIGLLWAAIILWESAVFSWPWFLAWVGIAVAAGPAINYMFGVNGRATLRERLIVAAAAPFTLFVICGVAKRYEIASMNLLESAVTFALMLVTANVLLFSSWIGFFLSAKPWIRKVIRA